MSIELTQLREEIQTRLDGLRTIRQTNGVGSNSINQRYFACSLIHDALLLNSDSVLIQEMTTISQAVMVLNDPESLDTARTVRHLLVAAQLEF